MIEDSLLLHRERISDAMLIRWDSVIAGITNKSAKMENWYFCEDPYDKCVDEFMDERGCLFCSPSSTDGAFVQNPAPTLHNGNLASWRVPDCLGIREPRQRLLLSRARVADRRADSPGLSVSRLCCSLRTEFFDANVMYLAHC